MVPPSDGSDHLVRVLGPAEGARVVVGLSEVSVARRLERDGRLRDATLELLFSELGEKPLTAFSQRLMSAWSGR